MHDIFIPSHIDRTNISVRIYIPEQIQKIRQKVPVLFYIHGGGFTLGSPLDTPYIDLSFDLARRGNLIAIGIDYRRSPEYPFPIPLEDCYSALLHFSERSNQASLSEYADFSRTIVAGDSAGGNLAATVSLLVRDRSREDPSLFSNLKICHQINIYPAFIPFFDQQHFPTKSNKDLRDSYILPAEWMIWFWHKYVPEEKRSQKISIYINPLNTNLTGMPPAQIITAEYDPLLDEGRMYRDALLAANVPVYYHHYKSCHGFIAFSELDEYKGAINNIIAHLREVKIIE